MVGWLGWNDIEENLDFEDWGVYRVGLVNSKGFPIRIPRFLDIDKDGILQISRSINIKEIKFFRGALEGKQYSHPEGQRLYLVLKYTNFGDIYRGIGCNILS